MQERHYLESRAEACRKLARRQRQPEMARALLELADVYERQMECAASRPMQQMR